MKPFVVKSFFYAVGLMVIALGITLTIASELGSGAWDALNVGLTESIGLTIGTWVMIIGAVLILANAWIAKDKPDLLAVITILLLGRFIDFWTLQVFDNVALSAWWMQFIVLLAGIFILALGVSLYIQPKFSLNPVDGLMIALQKRFGYSITKAKTLTEIFALVLALSLDGPVGIGTIMIIFLIGPSIQFFDGKANTVMNKMIS
ncbi:YczE/YyaS/YitT family protein [Halobacillus litoralis]|uniref:YczE/YyaS/YitT family protein n=1 Tax=Halobacillus litoralis TaxID=45668 RepID=UPI001CFC5810|nr:membrane protein [Halobacillus litoralis]